MHKCSKRYIMPILEEYKDYDDETKLKALMLSLSGYEPPFRENLNRELECRCLYAWHGQPAPVIITLAGTPIRGIFILTNGFNLQPTPFSSPIVFYSPVRDYVCKILLDTYREVYRLIEIVAKQKCSECFPREKDEA